MSDSVWPHRRQPTRLPRPWDSPGKNTGVGCHFLLQCIKVKSESEVTQSCLTLSNSMDRSLPGSSIHGIFQARVLEWGAIAFSDQLVILHKLYAIWKFWFILISFIILINPFYFFYFWCCFWATISSSSQQDNLYKYIYWQTGQNDGVVYPRLTSFHEHDRFEATYKATISENYLKTSRKNFPQLSKKKKPNWDR